MTRTPFKGSPWTRAERARRAAWILVEGTVFRFSWHNWYGFRRGLLRLFGARIGVGCVIRPTAHIEMPWHLTMGPYSSLGDHAICYSLGQVVIGARVTVSQYAHLCAGTHDYTRKGMPLLAPPITIEDDAWLAADSFVGPNVRIGTRAVLGARSSAFADLESGWVYVGSPARKLKKRAMPADERA